NCSSSQLYGKLDDRRVEGQGRTHRIEVLAKKSDLPGPGANEQDILLAVNASSRLEETFRPYVGDGRCWVCESMRPHIRKAELRFSTAARNHVTCLTTASRPDNRSGCPMLGAYGSSHTMSSAIKVCHRALSATSVSKCCWSKADAVFTYA